MGQTLGNLGQAFKNPNTFAPDPSGFNGSEWAARLIGGGAKGLGQGLQNTYNINPMMKGGGGGMGPMPGAMPVDPSYFQPQRRGPNNLNFYGDSNG